jgi:hypothetical protein
MTSRPWRQLSEIAAHADALVTQAEELREEMFLAIQDTPQDPQPVAVTHEVSRELSAAAARLTHAAQALQVAATGLVATQGVHRVDAEPSTGKWLARHNGISGSDAVTLQRAWRALEQFPFVRAGYRDGRLTLGHLSSIGRIIPARFVGRELNDAIAMVSDIQQLLLEVAEEVTVDQFAKFCSRVRQRLDVDGTRDVANEPSRIWLTELFNGRWALKGDLSELDGPVLASLISDHLARQAAQRTERAKSEGSGDEPPTPRSEKMATALAQLAMAGAAAGKPGRVGLFVHIDIDDLHLDPTPELTELLDPKRPFTEAGFDLSDDTLWSLMFDADVTPIYNRNGTPLSYGRSRRLAPPMLRRALAYRDRHCRTPGCEAPPNRLHIHHVRHWDDGNGTTDPDNNVGECNGHHHNHHDRGWGISGDPNGEMVHTRPDGRVFDASPAYRDRLKQRREAERQDILRRLRAGKAEFAPTG